MKNEKKCKKEKKNMLHSREIYLYIIVDLLNIDIVFYKVYKY